MDTEIICFEKDIPSEKLDPAADIFFEAFGRKFIPLFKSRERIIDFLRLSLQPGFMFAAYINGNMAGITGIQTGNSKLIDINYKKLKDKLGIRLTITAMLVFKIFFNQKSPSDTLRIEAIAVHPEYRGKGIGTFMIGEIEKYALNIGLKKLSLEVVDTNPKAKKLYERLGFRKIKTIKYGFLAQSAGFSSEDVMEKRL